MEERGSVLRWLHRGGENRWGTDPADLDPERIRAALDRLSGWFGPGRYFRVSVEGWDDLPASPVILAGNHSGGTSIPDAWGFAWAWYRRFGSARPFHPMAHEMVLSTRLTGPAFSRFGVLRTSPERAREVLETWKRDILVMPGGDLDTWRPFRDRYKVRFSGRRGYARLALRCRVPVVPVAQAGSHSTLIVLTDGARFAERIGLPQIARARIFPVHLSFPWGLAVGPLPHIPPPAHFRFRLGAPVPLPDLPPGEEPPEDAVEDYDARVRASLQEGLDRLADTSRLARLRRTFRGRR